MNKITIISIVLFTLLSSCLVSKKKYDALNAQNKKSIDSLSLIIDKTRFQYNKEKNILDHNAKVKDSMLDSLDLIVRRLANDTTNLSSSLSNAISDYNDEKNKLIQIEKRLNLKIKQSDSLRISLENEQKRLSQKSEEIEGLSSQQEQKKMEIDSLRRTLIEKQKRLAQLENMIEKNKDDVNKLKKVINNALKSFDDSELNVYLKDGKVYIAMEENLLFKSGSSKIDKRGQDAIIKLAKILETNTETEILIEGHTDNVGSDDFNWKLSTQRALSVVDIITKNTNVKATRITASGRGMHKPIADNTTEDGRQKNRRIDIILVPKLDSLYEIMNE